jgi:hypothetical protein
VKASGRVNDFLWTRPVGSSLEIVRESDYHDLAMVSTDRTDALG